MVHTRRRGGRRKPNPYCKSYIGFKHYVNSLLLPIHEENIYKGSNFSAANRIGNDNDCHFVAGSFLFMNSYPQRKFWKIFCFHKKRAFKFIVVVFISVKISGGKISVRRPQGVWSKTTLYYFCLLNHSLRLHAKFQLSSMI